MAKITEFHAHVYFGPETRDAAVRLCEDARMRFEIQMGRVQEKPVGPHPHWSCQLAFAPEKFGEVIPWLALHRGKLGVFIHPETGDFRKDHTDHVMWLGPSATLNLKN